MHLEKHVQGLLWGMEKEIKANWQNEPSRDSKGVG